MESCPRPANCVFGETAAAAEHFVEGGDAVARFEFPYVGADTVDNAGDVITRVGVVVREVLGNFPD